MTDMEIEGLDDDVGFVITANGHSYDWVRTLISETLPDLIVNINASDYVIDHAKDEGVVVQPYDTDGDGGYGQPFLIKWDELRYLHVY